MKQCNLNSKWQRPITTRRYIHPPKSERLYTLWLEGKIIFGELEHAICSQYNSLISSGIWFVHGKNAESFDFHNSKNIIHPEGIPIHAIKNKLGDLDIEIEAFSNTEKKSACFIKVTISNNTDKEASEVFGFILKTGLERVLAFGAPDVYSSYNPDIKVWKDLNSNWLRSGNVFFDGDKKLVLQSDTDFEFKNSTALANITLKPNENKEFVFAFDISKEQHINYSEQKEKTTVFWQNELKRINKLPEKITNDPEKLNTIKNLAIQLMQCFCCPINKNYMFARQGGLQRQIWTYETMPVLEALSRLGDFDDYIEPILDMYFNTLWTETGEIVPLGIPWALTTASVLYSFSQYSEIRGKDFFLKYRDKAIKSFYWIRDTRKLSLNQQDSVAGLFPAMRSCDDPNVSQFWLNTDSMNIIGLKAFKNILKHFNDPLFTEVEDEINSYLNVILSIWKPYVDAAKNSNELKVPLTPTDNAEAENKFLFSPHFAYFIQAIEPEKEVIDKMIAYRKNRGIVKGGLYNKMPDKEGLCPIWYVCEQEYFIFYMFKKFSQKDKMEEIVRDNLMYGMTEEYYMLERYNQDDPYYAPWMPNASASGRMINMLLDL